MTAIALRYAQRSQILDVPNARSSHDSPTPRGGGIGFVLVLILALVLIASYSITDLGLTLYWLLGIILVAGIGWLDDHFSMPNRVRLLVQLFGTILFVASLGEVSPIHWETGFFQKCLAVVFIGLYLIWLTNLYNFMDGIDGLAATQGICTALAAAFFFALGGQSDLSYLGCVTAAAMMAFLVFNWPPAKIFMGDVGSYALGFLFGCFAIIGEVTESVSLWVWIILLGVFIFDATFTLFHRMIKGERWYAAHCQHAYQRLIQMGWSHRDVVLSVLVVNVLILWPSAAAAWYFPDVAPWFTVVLGVLAWGVWYLILRLNEQWILNRSDN